MFGKINSVLQKKLRDYIVTKDEYAELESNIDANSLEKIEKEEKLEEIEKNIQSLHKDLQACFDEETPISKNRYHQLIKFVEQIKNVTKSIEYCGINVDPLPGCSPQNKNPLDINELALELRSDKYAIPEYRGSRKEKSTHVKVEDPGEVMTSPEDPIEDECWSPKTSSANETPSDDSNDNSEDERSLEDEINAENGTKHQSDCRSSPPNYWESPNCFFVKFSPLLRKTSRPKMISRSYKKSMEENTNFINRFQRHRDEALENFNKRTEVGSSPDRSP